MVMELLDGVPVDQVSLRSSSAPFFGKDLSLLSVGGLENFIGLHEINKLKLNFGIMHHDFFLQIFYEI